MENNTFTKEILTINNKIFKAIHNIYDFDFEKDFNIATIENESFTVKKIDKITNGAKYVLILMQGATPYNKDYLYSILKKNNNLEPLTHELMKNKNVWGYRVDYFFSKGSFEENRKENKKAWLIWSNDFEPNYKNRLNSSSDIDTTTNRFVFNCNYTNTVNYKCINNNKFYEFSKFIYRNTTQYELDKSGYFVNVKRDNLAKRARALRSEREKNAFNNFDTTEKMQEIENALNDLLSLYVEKAKNVKNHNDFNNLTRYAIKSPISDALFDYELLQERINKNNIPSIQFFNDKYISIINTINNGINSLNEL